MNWHTSIICQRRGGPGGGGNMRLTVATVWARALPWYLPASHAVSRSSWPAVKRAGWPVAPDWGKTRAAPSRGSEIAMLRFSNSEPIAKLPCGRRTLIGLKGCLTLVLELARPKVTLLGTAAPDHGSSPPSQLLAVFQFCPKGGCRQGYVRTAEVVRSDWHPETTSSAWTKPYSARLGRYDWNPSLRDGHGNDS